MHLCITWHADDPSLRYPSVESWLNEQQKFPVEFGVPLLVVALAQIWSRSGADLWVWCLTDTAAAAPMREW